MLDISAAAVVALVSVVPAILILARSVAAFLVGRNRNITRVTLKVGEDQITLDSTSPEDAERIIRAFLTERRSEEFGKEL